MTDDIGLDLLSLAELPAKPPLTQRLRERIATIRANNPYPNYQPPDLPLLEEALAELEANTPVSSETEAPR